MSDDTEKQKTKAELDNLTRLIDRYAQSRSLGLLIPIMIIVIIVVLVIGTGKLVAWKPEAWWAPHTIWVLMGVIAGLFWLGYKLGAKYDFYFYQKDGKIELQTEKIPLWMWAAFLIPTVGATFLSMEIMPTRWALTLALGSTGLFSLGIRKKEKSAPLCIVVGSLLLIEAALIAVGVPMPFAGREWTYSFFIVFEMSVVFAGLIAAVMVHIYNRVILRKIKRARLFGEQEKNSAGL